MVAVDCARSEAFGDDADRYDRARPSYPNELVSDLLAAEPRAILDVGCGTGIASRSFEGQGRRLLGIEPDPRMASVARQHGLDVELARFEEWNPHGRSFDLLISGQAWHWVEPAAGAAKAAEVLHSGGRFGAFWNHAVHESEVAKVLSRVYARHAPQLLESGSVVLGNLGQKSAVNPGADVLSAGLADPDAAALGSAGAFGEITRRSYSWARPYTAESWLDELPTHSDHRFLDETARDVLFEDLRSELAELGPTFPVGYHTSLLTALRL